MPGLQAHLMASQGLTSQLGMYQYPEHGASGPCVVSLAATTPGAPCISFLHLLLHFIGIPSALQFIASIQRCLYPDCGRTWRWSSIDPQPIKHQACPSY